MDLPAYELRRAEHPNVAIKISGLGRPGLPWTLTANGGIIRDTINIFGPERCMFASNFPVDGLAGSFPVIYGGFRAAVSNRSQGRSTHSICIFQPPNILTRLDATKAGPGHCRDRSAGNGTLARHLS